MSRCLSPSSSPVSVVGTRIETDPPRFTSLFQEGLAWWPASARHSIARGNHVPRKMSTAVITLVIFAQWSIWLAGHGAKRTRSTQGFRACLREPTQGDNSALYSSSKLPFVPARSRVLPHGYGFMIQPSYRCELHCRGRWRDRYHRRPGPCNRPA